MKRSFVNLRHALVLVGAVVIAAVAAQTASSIPNCTAAQGQAFIALGDYTKAVQEFSCVIAADPTGVEGYRGRAEANLLRGRYADALADYGRITAFVTPVHPDAQQVVFAGYAARLAEDADDLVALTGASFARWAAFDYGQASHLLGRLLEVDPDDPYGTLFRGSTRLLKRGATVGQGVADLERAIELAPTNPHVRFVVADAYTYGLIDLDRAFSEATLALEGGLDTPRVHAILATALNAFGETDAAAQHVAAHFAQVTTQLVTTAPLGPGESLTVDIVPGLVGAIPIPVTAGETISVSLGSKDYWDTIALLVSPDGTPVLGRDDDVGYHVDFDWVAQQTGTYWLHATFFEGVQTGRLVVTRG